MEYSTRQTKRKLSDSYPSEPPAYAPYPEVTSPLSHDFVQHNSSQSYVRDDDENAAEVLTQLARTPPAHDMSANASTLGSPLSRPMSSTSLVDLGNQQHPIVLLVSAVTKLPLVTNAVKYYETSKRNYASFNYAAGFVERAAMPVFNKIEVNLNNIHQARIEERALKKKRRRTYCLQDKNESQRRLKFCLHILKLANDNISARVNSLQQKITDKENGPVEDYMDEKHDHAKVEQNNEMGTNDLTAVLSSDVPKEAQETKTEIIATVKKIIHVISNFRPSTLTVEKTAEASETAEVKLKTTIKEIILNLPNQIQQTAVPSSVQANEKIILFARESLEMINRLTNVFNEQLEKAESWVDGDAEENLRKYSPPNASNESVATKHD